VSEVMDNYKKLAIAGIIITLFIASIIIVRLPSPIGSIIVPDDYSSIQTAIDHAFEGQTIFVRSGIYTEQHITINKPLSLIGNNPNNTILVGINSERYSPPYVIQISADNVKISGFTIMDGSLGGIRVETIGSNKQPSGCIITGNNVLDNPIGVSTYDGKDLTISNNQFSNNTLYGIYVTTSSSNIFENSITGSGWFGIIVDSCNDVSIHQNTIARNGNLQNNGENGGICLRWFGNFNVYKNNITNNEGDGIQFSEGCSHSNVHDNNIERNNVGVDLFNFAISNNSENIGIGSDDQVYGNNLENAKNAFIQTTFAYGNISNIYYAIGNGTDVVSWDNGIIGNYWSDYTGNGTYLIDQNNIDHHPLNQPVVISVKAPTLTSLPTSFSITLPLLLLLLTVVIGTISFLFFCRIHKRTQVSYK
jgi:parallel beta-helix repeat protein